MNRKQLIAQSLVLAVLIGLWLLVLTLAREWLELLFGLFVASGSFYLLARFGLALLRFALRWATGDVSIRIIDERPSTTGRPKGEVSREVVDALVARQARIEGDERYRSSSRPTTHS